MEPRFDGDEDEIVRWDPHGPLGLVAALWGEAEDDVRVDLAGLPVGIEPVSVLAEGPAGPVLLAVALYVPSRVSGTLTASLARVSLAPGVSADRGGALVRWAEARARDEGAARLEVVERRAPGLGAMLEARGYSSSNAMIRLRRTRPRPVPPLPAGLEERLVTVASLDAWVAVYNASFASVPFSAPSTRAECEEALRARGSEASLIRLLFDGVEPVAFLNGGMHADGSGEVRAIGVVPQAQGRGLGRWVLRRCEELLDAAGAREVFLRVAETNRAARALYQREEYVEVSRHRAWSRAPGSA